MTEITVRKDDYLDHDSIKVRARDERAAGSHNHQEARFQMSSGTAIAALQSSVVTVGT